MLSLKQFNLKFILLPILSLFLTGCYTSFTPPIEERVKQKDQTYYEDNSTQYYSDNGENNTETIIYYSCGIRWFTIAWK